MIAYVVGTGWEAGWRPEVICFIYQITMLNKFFQVNLGGLSPPNHQHHAHHEPPDQLPPPMDHQIPHGVGSLLTHYGPQMILL